MRGTTVDAYLSDIVGLQEVANRQRAKQANAPAELMDIPGIRVIDDYTLEIELKQPTPYFLGKLTYLVSAPIDKDFAPMDQEMTDVGQMIGTGPFKIASYERDQMIVLEANADYHGGPPAVVGADASGVTGRAQRG